MNGLPREEIEKSLREPARRPRVLIAADYYLPGFKAGGPIRTLANLTTSLTDEFDFYVITRDRDHGDTQPYPIVSTHGWQELGRSRILYLPPGKITPVRIREAVAAVDPELIYLNSAFSPRLTIATLVLRRFGLIKRVPVLVAPRGEFARGALALKKWKKSAYLGTSHLFGLYRDVAWQATSRDEARDIRAHFRSDEIHVVPNISSPLPGHAAGTRKPKKPGHVRIICVARIARNKNILYALSRLSNLSGSITFEVCGPAEDAQYALDCERAAAQLPPNVEVRWRGAMAPELIREAVVSSDLFFLPTAGENFGHAIQEALAAGCPVLISDRTPWRDLAAKGVGWDLPLSDPGPVRRRRFRRWSTWTKWSFDGCQRTRFASPSKPTPHPTPQTPRSDYFESSSLRRA